MGKTSREKPKLLAEKLLRIREELGLSQTGLLRHLGIAGRLSRSQVSEFERGDREPSLPVLLRYAHAAGVCVDVLIDDEADLPRKLPSVPKHKGQ